MAIIVNKWGNSLGLRIPQPIASEIGLTVGSVVNIEVVGNKIVISPIRKKYQLHELLEGVTPDLVGGEYDWGEPVGEEAIATQCCKAIDQGLLQGDRSNTQ